MTLLKVQHTHTISITLYYSLRDFIWRLSQSKSRTVFFKNIFELFSISEKDYQFLKRLNLLGFLEKCFVFRKDFMSLDICFTLQ